MDRTDRMNLMELDKESENLELKDAVMLRISEIVDTLQDLTPEEMKAFKEAVKRRKFFK